MYNSEDIRKLMASINSDFKLIPISNLPDSSAKELFKIIVEYVNIMSEVLDSDEKNNYKYVKGVTNEQLMTMIMFHNTLLDLFQKEEMYELCVNVKKINDVLQNQLRSNEEKNNPENS